MRRFTYLEDFPRIDCRSIFQDGQEHGEKSTPGMGRFLNLVLVNIFADHVRIHGGIFFFCSYTKE